MAGIFDTMQFGTLPVVDDAGNLTGIVSASDLVEQDRPLHIPTVISLFDWVIPIGGGRCPSARAGQNNRANRFRAGIIGCGHR